MGTFLRLLLGLCTLHLFVSSDTIVDASRTPWTTAKNRRARAVNKPTPIDCRVGSWSSWTPCDSCTDRKFSFRYLEKPSQFGGTECIDILWRREMCPRSATPCLVPDYCEESFTCKETGRCISRSLQCNGEPDCDDFSDEDGCENVNQRNDKCSTLIPIPGAERGTQGYNVLSGELMDHVLDPRYFGGECEYVYNGEWRKFTYDAFCENLHYNEDEKNYRKPYNYHTYHFMAQASSKGSSEYFDDMLSLLKARKTVSSSKSGFTFGISHVEVGLGGSSENTFLNNITQFKSQDLGFIWLNSEVQTARFKMRTNKLMLHEDFYVSLMELPEEYDFGMYSRFFNTFGTHYITEGTMGGTVEYVMIVNKTKLENLNINADEAGSCFGASFGLSIPVGSSAAIEPKLSGKLCNKEGHFNEDRKGSSAIIEDVVTKVSGGITDSSAGLNAIRNPDMYRKWGFSLKYNPALIDYEIMPIHELVRISTAADHVGDRLANLQRAIDEYLQQFNPCRCAPCSNNGIPVLSGTSCNCMCRSGYQGYACEITSRRETKADGSWSCWGAWSPCTSRRKTRTRVCNNPPPQNGGATCLGSASQTWPC
ncbi:complement component C8 alpha chain [Pundamilia nyererei]|uniref:Complement C8 alpha chain n=1 Tax=Pundamilia nyererei TaxID=303518 RepID=A0A3B4EV48_9CICH|nr:PREDICTED: complement component C8 alpha chain [Pundamilia nyererei]